MIHCSLNKCETKDNDIYSKLKIYVDQDGTLADFEKHFENTFGIQNTWAWKREMLAKMTEDEFDNIFWHMVESIEDFWETIPPICEYNSLLEEIKPFGPTVLTAVPKNFARENAIRGKTKWVDRYIGPDVPIIFTDVIKGRISKKEYCKGLNYVLIDDNVLLINEWRKQGGIAIHHEGNMLSTINNVKQIIQNYSEYEKVIG